MTDKAEYVSASIGLADRADQPVIEQLPVYRGEPSRPTERIAGIKEYILGTRRKLYIELGATGDHEFQTNRRRARRSSAGPKRFAT